MLGLSLLNTSIINPEAFTVCAVSHRYYGQEFRYAATGISVHEGGSLFDRAKRGPGLFGLSGASTMVIKAYDASSAPAAGSPDTSSNVQSTATRSFYERLSLKIGIVEIGFATAWLTMAPDTS